ncbi:PAS domain S-box protein [Sphingomonas morindae]|uniref:histidine kinase n=1 Tax=Sphingomonas morindae TaxID=1541170 RepID=A0ABY4X9C1_9SPHN|nr:PAS domain S-box protein [Sphingomonas morindae]USI73522.1 PAS domain S-box protein [Sphingomonas morindae]
MTALQHLDAADLPAPLRFLAGGGEATRLILARDWSDHPLGAPEGWSDALKSSLSLVLNSPESMILAWGQGELTFFFNEAYFPLLGPRLPRAMGFPFREVWADAWAQAKPIIDDAFAGRSQRFINLPWKLDTDRGRADTWFSFSYSRVLDAQGDVAGLFILTNETTEQVLAAQEREAAVQRLRESEQHFRLMADAVPQIVWLTDADGNVEFFNKQWANYTGIDFDIATAAEVAATAVHPDDGPATMTAFDTARSTGTTFSVEHRIRAADGSYRWFLVRADPYRDPNSSRVIRWFGASIDIHDRRLAEAAQQESEARLRVLAESLEQQVVERTADRNRLWQLSTDIMLVADLDGRIEAVNPAWTRMLGWTEAELLGELIFAFIHPEDVDHTLAGAAGIAVGESYAKFENRYRHKDGSYRDIAWAAGPGDGKIIAVGRDATEEKARAVALSQAEEQLRQAQKMEAVGQLTGGLAHDFNNLLTGMMGNLELLQLRVARGRLDDLDRLINAAQGAGRRAASLTQRLLAFSRRQTLDPKPADVDRLIAGLDDMLRRTVGAGVEIDVVPSAGLWTANIDAGQLENAVLNLCINARDAMPDGGKIKIATDNAVVDERLGRELDLEPGQYVRVGVADTGTGMSVDTIRRAYEPFFTTKPIGQGTGLGLSMIYGFARQSGGQVRIQSELGRGTTVCIYLPRHHGVAETPAEEADRSPAESGAGQTVLIIDDEATIRHLVDEVLDELGYTVIGAADGAAGIKVLQSGARIELLITDVGLPGGMNGRQVADAARAIRPGLKVLFITGFAENAAVGNGHLEPGMELLTKPFSLEALTNKVAEMLRVKEFGAIG